MQDNYSEGELSRKAIALMDEGASSEKVRGLRIQKNKAHLPEDSPELEYSDNDNLPQSLSSLSSINDQAITNKELEEQNARSYFDDTSMSGIHNATEYMHPEIIPPERVSSRVSKDERHESKLDNQQVVASDTSSSSMASKPRNVSYNEHSSSPQATPDVSARERGNVTGVADDHAVEEFDDGPPNDYDDKNSAYHYDTSHGHLSDQQEFDFELKPTSPQFSSHSADFEQQPVPELNADSDRHPQHEQYEAEQHGHYADSEHNNSSGSLIPAKSRYVGSNGSPHGIRETSDRSLIAPSFDPLDDSDDEEGPMQNIESSSSTKAGIDKPSVPENAFKSPITSKRSTRNLDYVSPVQSSSPRNSPHGSFQHKSPAAEEPSKSGLNDDEDDELNEDDDNEFDSIFDNANEVLAHGGPSANFSRRRAAQSKRSNKLEGPSAFLSFNGDSIVGFRAKEQERRKLETENLELKMKLQEYREMSASENDISKMKHELARAENRIDELERALERKNKVIEELTIDRDQAFEEINEAESSRKKEQERADGLYSEINELQALIVELEQQDKKLLTQAHKDFPDILPENPDLAHLLEALRSTVEQNETLTRVSALASSLKAQNGQVQAAVRESGQSGDPSLVIRNLSRDVNGLQARERELLGMLNEAEDHRHELTLALTRLEETTRDARAQSYAIIQNFFAELFDVLGEDFQAKVEVELKDIVERSQSMSHSKIPPLMELMAHYTRAIADMAQNGRVFTNTNQRIQELETQNSSLEHLIELKMEKLKADNILRAQIRDLKREVKRVNELRQNEWNEYQRNIQNS